MKKYDQWRDSEIKKVGLKRQLAAEAIVDKHQSCPFVEVNDDKSGMKKRFRSDVADVLVLKGNISRPKKYFSMPSRLQKIMSNP